MKLKMDKKLLARAQKIVRERKSNRNTGGTRVLRQWDDVAKV